MRQEKRQAYLNVSLSRNTVADRVCDLATDLKQQLMGKGKGFVAYSLAVDESSDTSDTAQLSIFIRGFDSVHYRETSGIEIHAWHSYGERSL